MVEEQVSVSFLEHSNNLPGTFTFSSNRLRISV